MKWVIATFLALGMISCSTITKVDEKYRTANSQLCDQSKDKEQCQRSPAKLNFLADMMKTAL